MCRNKSFTYVYSKLCQRCCQSNYSLGEIRQMNKANATEFIYKKRLAVVANPFFIYSSVNNSVSSATIAVSSTGSPIPYFARSLFSTSARISG